jgi:hypothetical protein
MVVKELASSFGKSEPRTAKEVCGSRCEERNGRLCQQMHACIEQGQKRGIFDKEQRPSPELE